MVDYKFNISVDDQAFMDYLEYMKRLYEQYRMLCENVSGRLAIARITEKGVEN